MVMIIPHDPLGQAEMAVSLVLPHLGTEHLRNCCTTVRLHSKNLAAIEAAARLRTAIDTGMLPDVTLPKPPRLVIPN